jgi:tetratricopeptide (TPR) repeat protein
MKNRLTSFFIVLFLFSCSSNDGVPNAELTLAEQIEKANIEFDEARLDRAEAMFLKIVKKNPGYIEAWLKLGNIYVRQTRLKAAIRCFEEAIKIDQKDGRAWYNLALVRVAQATQTLETAEQIVPLDSQYQSYFLRLHHKLLNKKTN